MDEESSPAIEFTDRWSRERASPDVIQSLGFDVLQANLVNGAKEWVIRNPDKPRVERIAIEYDETTKKLLVLFTFTGHPFSAMLERTFSYTLIEEPKLALAVVVADLASAYYSLPIFPTGPPSLPDPDASFQN